MSGEYMVIGEGATPAPEPGPFECSECGEEKPASEFYLRRQRGGTYRHRQCMECMRAQRAEYMRNRRESETYSKEPDEFVELPPVTPLELKVLASASCRGDLRFIQQKRGGDHHRMRSELEAICNACPVLAECRQWTEEFEGQLPQARNYYAGFRAGEYPLERYERRKGAAIAA